MKSPNCFLIRYYLQLRLDTILQLQKLNWLVFALLELDRSRRASGVTPKTLAGDVATAIALGGVVPIVIAIVAEVCV